MLIKYFLPGNHSSRIIFVSSQNGAYTVSDVEIYPKNLKTD